MVRRALTIGVLLTASAAVGADYAGSKVCAGCHVSIAREYMQRPMARSSGLVSELQLPSGDVIHSGRSHRIQDSALVLGSRSIPARWYIGSGAAGRSFAYDFDGYLFQLPVSWYS